MPSKTVVINGKPREITGLSETDPYYAGIGDHFEDTFSGFCARYLKPDYVCWDVGANIGVTALLMADHCPDGQIVAVEANRPVYELLCRNVRENGAQHVTPIHAAVGDRDGEAFFNEQSSYGHVASSGTAVTMITPETLLARSGARPPDFLKVDCEGYEPFILKSALDLLQRGRAFVHLEFNSWCLLHHSRSHPLEFLEWLVGAFSQTYIVREGGALEPFGADKVPAILHDNLMKYGCVNDLVVSNEPSRFS